MQLNVPPDLETLINRPSGENSLTAQRLDEKFRE
jgi:hypothetical protein